MKRLTYVSKFSRPITDSEIEEIGAISERNNHKANITGVLIALGGVFFQVIEGENEKVDALFGKICCDERHTNILSIRVEEDIEERQFMTWNMKTINLQGSLGAIVQKPMKILFQTVTDQLQHRFFIEKLLGAFQMEPEEVIQVGFEECIEQTLSEKAFLYVWDFQDNKFRVKDTFGLEELEPNEEYQRVESLLLESAREMSFLHVFFVPVIYQEQTVAVMILGSPEPFDDRKQETCAVISSHVTIGYEVSLQGETLREYLASLEKEKEQISSSHIIVDKEAFYQLDSSLLSLQNRLDALLEKSPSQWSGKASELADLREVAESLTGLLRENKLKQQSAARKMPQTETIDV